MSKPIFAEADLQELRDLIIFTLRNNDDITIPKDKRKKLMEIYHRMNRTNKPETTMGVRSPDAPWIKDD